MIDSADAEQKWIRWLKPKIGVNELLHIGNKWRQA